MTRRGFTLLEILLAFSMLGTILGIVWGVLFIFAQMEARRTQHVQQQQLIRTWTQVLNDDFRNVLQDVEQFNKAEGSETIRHFGVDGTETQLRIDVADYSWRSAESSALRTIFYEFPQTGGLIRRERDYAAPQSATEAVRIASELASGQFRYFDGGTWHPQWVSLERKSAPSAIEVTFSSLPFSDTNKPTQHRIVVQIPSVSQGFSESYQRVQPPRPPQEDQPPPPPSPQAPSSPPPNPFHSLFGND
jgi:type II secretory pathway component PulJ